MKILRVQFFAVIFVFSCVSIPVFSDPVFMDSEEREIRIAAVKSVDEIDLVRGKDILVRAFMTGYRDVPLVELNPAFQSTDDMRCFYESYFDSELAHFQQGKLIWVQAFDRERLVGWATFELEKQEKHAVYMNLLVVDPDEQRRGIGKHLTFSIRSHDLYPETQFIDLLIRKVNESGRRFYEKIGFFDFQHSVQDNFVDQSLLTGLRWSLEGRMKESDRVNCDFYNSSGESFNTIPFEDTLPQLLLKHGTGRTLLEIGSGPGALAAWLVEQGYEVTCLNQRRN
jgi:ribosomal protein S18 acetylase RimI-like enzyme